MRVSEYLVEKAVTGIRAVYQLAGALADVEGKGTNHSLNENEKESLTRLFSPLSSFALLVLTAVVMNLQQKRCAVIGRP